MLLFEKLLKSRNSSRVFHVFIPTRKKGGLQVVDEQKVMNNHKKHSIDFYLKKKNEKRPFSNRN